jgi:succinylglutamic semialdehyde dehydrogenase
VQAACAAARAFYAWSHRPLAERIACVQRFAALLERKRGAGDAYFPGNQQAAVGTRTEVQAMIGKAASRSKPTPSVPASAKRDAGR